jgi:hypothetical protein
MFLFDCNFPVQKQFASSNEQNIKQRKMCSIVHFHLYVSFVLIFHIVTSKYTLEQLCRRNLINCSMVGRGRISFNGQQSATILNIWWIHNILKCLYRVHIRFRVRVHFTFVCIDKYEITFCSIICCCKSFCCDDSLTNSNIFY